MTRNGILDGQVLFLGERRKHSQCFLNRSSTFTLLKTAMDIKNGSTGKGKDFESYTELSFKRPEFWTIHSVGEIVGAPSLRHELNKQDFSGKYFQKMTLLPMSFPTMIYCKSWSNYIWTT
jgi:hypothetical protein